VIRNILQNNRYFMDFCIWINHFPVCSLHSPTIVSPADLHLVVSHINYSTLSILTGELLGYRVWFWMSGM